MDVDVTVVDRKGRPVRGLGRDDFEVYEDGVLQTLDSFRQVDIPMPPRPVAGAAQQKWQAPRDVTSNAADGRVYVMLLDGTGGAPLLRTRLVARRFVTEALGPDDLMAVIVVNSMMSHSHGFTSDKARLLSVIDRFGGSRWEGMSDALVDISERSSATGDAYGLIRVLAERLGDIPGRRKSILWVGGAPSFHHTDFRQAEEAFAQRAAIRAASRNNVAVYPIDPHGLTTAMGRSGDGAPGRLPRHGRGHRRRSRRQHQQLHRQLPPHRRAEQRVLRPRLCSSSGRGRWPVSPHQGESETSWPQREDEKRIQSSRPRH